MRRRRAGGREAGLLTREPAIDLGATRLAGAVARRGRERAVVRRARERELRARELVGRDRARAAQRERAGQHLARAGDVAGTEPGLAETRQVVGEVGVSLAERLLVDRERAPARQGGVGELAARDRHLAEVRQRTARRWWFGPSAAS